MNPKILVAVCHYNHQEFLKQSIESVVNQTYENLDICIVDDGSDEPELFDEIVASFNDSRIRVIKSDENSGKWWALNKAVETSDALICTSHDADDISLPWRIQAQLDCIVSTHTVHNLCGFHHCWSEEDIRKNLNHKKPETLNVMGPSDVYNAVMVGWNHPSVNHYFTGDFETAGVSGMFYKSIWDMGIRFYPSAKGLRCLLSEDSDFNFRCTALLQNTSILAEKPYLYRRETSTNKEEM